MNNNLYVQDYIKKNIFAKYSSRKRIEIMFKNKLMKYHYPFQLGLKIMYLRSSTDRVRPPKVGYPGSNPGGGFTFI